MYWVWDVKEVCDIVVWIVKVYVVDELIKVKFIMFDEIEFNKVLEEKGIYVIEIDFVEFIV